MAIIKWRGRWISFSVNWPLLIILAILVLTLLNEAID